MVTVRCSAGLAAACLSSGQSYFNSHCLHGVLHVFMMVVELTRPSRWWRDNCPSPAACLGYCYFPSPAAPRRCQWAPSVPAAGRYGLGGLRTVRPAGGQRRRATEANEKFTEGRMAVFTVGSPLELAEMHNRVPTRRSWPSLPASRRHHHHHYSVGRVIQRTQQAAGRSNAITPHPRKPAYVITFLVCLLSRPSVSLLVRVCV